MCSYWSYGNNKGHSNGVWDLKGLGKVGIDRHKGLANQGYNLIMTPRTQILVVIASQRHSCKQSCNPLHQQHVPEGP